jgi:CubicO group peptidase (beta-lactamase class C family)
MMEASLSENRETIAVLVACLVLTGGNIWLHRDSPPASWERMEQYGISFSHPPGFRFTSNTPTSWIPGYWDGGVQGEPTDGGLEIIGLYWITNKAGTTERAIEYIIDVAKEENPGLSIQEIKRMTVGELEVDYCNVVLEVEGMRVPGILCAFKDPYGRIILPYHLRYPGTFEYSETRIKQLIKSIEITPPTKPRSLTVYWPTDGWRHAAPEEMGMDGSLLQDMVDDIKSRPSSIQVDSVVVVKNGYIVFEEYFNDYTEDTPHIIYSCTKSVVSTIFGIAHENGAIPSLDTKLLDVFPDRTPANIDEWKESITLRDLLMMSGGFNARDSWLYEWEKLGDLHDAPDAVDYVLDLPMGFEPGSRFEYTNGVSHLLSCIITEKTGKSAAEYGQEYLFGSLGITLQQWDADNMGRNWGYNRIYLTPQDMAKIGYMFLKEGEWEGEQIISSDWVKEATTHRIDANLFPGYGYQWWVGEGYYTAMGYMGQFIYVFPEQDLIIVCTGGTPESYDYNQQIPFRFVLPAIN